MTLFFFLLHFFNINQCFIEKLAMMGKGPNITTSNVWALGESRLSKVRSRSGPAPFCGPRTWTSGPGPAILGPGPGPGHEYCGVMINIFFIFY